MKIINPWRISLKDRVTEIENKVEEIEKKVDMLIDYLNLEKKRIVAKEYFVKKKTKN